jgi:sigma-B regulation protein RsbU (phosphoserine phosphatase)
MLVAPGAVALIPSASFGVLCLFFVRPPSKNERLILKRASFLLVSITALYMLAALFLGYDAPLFTRIVMPVFYLANIGFPLAELTVAVAEERRQMRGTNDNLELLFGFVANAGEILAGRGNAGSIYQAALRSAVASSDADAGAIYLIDNSVENTLRRQSVVGNFVPPTKDGESRLEENGETIQLSGGVLDAVIREAKPVLLDSRSGAAGSYRSLALVPLAAENRVFGLVAVARNRNRSAFDESDFDDLQTFGLNASLVVDNMLAYSEVLDRKEIETEQAIGSNIQSLMQPGTHPSVSGLGYAGISRPTYGINSDYYDAVVDKNGRLTVIVCDVAGKGIVSSVIMVMIRTIFQLVGSSSYGPAQVVGIINRAISRRLAIDHFAALTLARFYPNEGRVELVNAGSQPVLAFRHDESSVEQFPTDDPPVGVDRRTEFQIQSISMDSGDILLLYTDGLIEAVNNRNKPFGREGVSSVLEQNASLGVDDLAQKLINDVEYFSSAGGRHDDETFVAVKVS